MSNELDLTKTNQHLMSIRKDGQKVGDIEIDENGYITTNGLIGYNVCCNFVELIRCLQGHDLKFDDIYF